MMKIAKAAAAASLAVLLATACTQEGDDAGANAGKQAADSQQPLVSGIEKDNFDTSVRPQDDFFRYVNGKWLDRTEIPADRSNYGSFTELAEEAEKAQLEIIKAAAANDSALPGSEEQKIGDFYRAFMNEERVEELGMSPVQPMLARIDAIETHEDVIRYFGEQQKHSVTTPIGFWVNNDSKEPTRYAVYLSQSGLGLPNRDYYEKEGFADKKAAYETYVADLLEMSGFTGGAERAAEVLALEERMAMVQWTPTENRDRNATYNKFTLAELNEVGDKFDWPLFLEAAGIHDKIDDVIVRQPSYAAALGDIVRDTDVETWKNYFRFHVMDAAAPFLSSQFVEREFAFSGKTLAGTEENRPRWKRAVGMINNVLGEAVGKIYVSQHFKPEAKARMEGLVANLTDAFEVGIDNLEWMSEETKKEAHDKLSKFTPKIGYPDKWKDYSSLEVSADDLFGNVVRATEFGYREQVGKLGGPIDADEWFMTPQTVNAYYNPPMNEIVFPAAILQPPFFNMEAEDAVNYGGIGAVIGHEISHGFDDQGRKSDGDGVLRDWWSPVDTAAFNARAEKLGEQYDNYCPFEDACVNGDFTMGENIGDLSGLKVAYMAYKMSLDGKEAPVIDGLTGDQRFFMGWAQVWRRLYRDDNLRMRLSTDPHSPSKYRTNGIVRNIDAWYDAFDVKEGDDLYLPPEERVSIW